jgi:chromosome segregation ATPase
MTNRSHSSSTDPQPDWEQSLIDLEESVSSLKQRYTQVKEGQQQKQDLQERLGQLQTELKQIKQQLALLEVELESRLLSWLTVKEPFWQAVRFGGLGFAIGWGLHWWLRR